MTDDVYRKLAKVLDTLPNGFPATESGIEIKILKWIFEPEEAELFCDLRLNFETAQQVSERTGRPLEGLEEKLLHMAERGEILTANMGGINLFKMVPYAVGIYEFTSDRMDQELAKLNEEYLPHFLPGLLGNSPPIFQTIPVEEDLTASQEALPYQKISKLLESCQSFKVSVCHCKKENGLLNKPCDRPVEVCLAMAPIPDAFANATSSGRIISREEARSILTMAEEKGMVHLTSNVQDGHYFICNCCSCCCGVLDGINTLGIPAWSVFNSDYYAVIDADRCTSCGICADERCQVKAIDAGEDVYEITPEKCIGCGLCISTCPEEAISLVKKSDEDIVTPPTDEMDWFRKRGQKRGVDFSKYE